MPDQPLRISRFIKLIVAEELDRAALRAWLGCVRDAAPSGVIATVQTVDDEGSPRAVRMVHREVQGRHEYPVPLTRDLSPEETERVVRAFADDFPDLDFDIETNATRLAASARNGISVGQEQHIALCTALAKLKHEDWLRERTSADWRYGPNFSVEDKTHPLLLPWEQLPDRFRQPDLDAPQKLINMLAQQGYTVVSREDLDRVVGKRGSA